MACCDAEGAPGSGFALNDVNYDNDYANLGAHKCYKECLHQLMEAIKEYMRIHLKLEIKGNYQVFPVADRGIDFVGYRFFHKYTLLRKSIKKRMAKMFAKKRNKQSIASYMGWANQEYCNSYNLLTKLHNGYDDQKIIQGLQYNDRERRA